MCSHKHAGATLHDLRKEMRLSQKALAVKTQLVDGNGIGIAESILSQIENGKRNLSPKYLNLIEATGIFTTHQMQELRNQAVEDMVLRCFGTTTSPLISKTES